MSNQTIDRGSALPVVGMVGAGQLARMTHQAAIDLGIDLVVLARSPAEPAARAGARTLVGAPDDPAALLQLAQVSDVLTLDHELVPIDALSALEGRGHRVRPRGEALRAAQDKLWARSTFAAWGLPVPAFTAITGDPEAELARFAERVGWPLVLKTPTGGYDGRGVHVATDLPEARPFLKRVGRRPLLAEAFVPIARELAVVGARSPSGAWVSYPLVQTWQVDGICRELVMPAPVSQAVARQAEAIARTLAERLDATGIIATELFLTAEDRLVVNEIALRPHNSGHATIEGAVTSQFENHLRAVLDWPLGDTSLTRPAAAMVNVLGQREGTEPRTRLAQALAVRGARVHLYDKAPAPGRKLGHVTALGATWEEALAVARESAAILQGSRGAMALTAPL